MPRLVNDALARILHNSLYERMVSFCEQYTPEFPAHPVVTAWLNRLYSGDDNLHIIVALDNNYKITGHTVIDVQEAYGYRVVFCHQALADKGNTATLDEGIEYIEKLREQVNAVCSIFIVTKHIKGLEKKYGYKIARTMMVKYTENESSEHE